MIISKSNERKLGVVLQYMQMGLSILIQLVYTPIMLRILGSSEYGIYNLASSIIGYLSLLSLGFGASYIRYFSIYKKDNDELGIKNLNGLYILVFTIIGIVSLLAGLFLTSKIEWFYNSSYTVREIEIARVLMFFLTINMAVSFPASVFVSYITSQEKFVFQKIVNMGKTLLSPAVSIIFLYLGYGSVGMVICTTAISIIVDVVNVFYCFNKLRMGISFHNPNFLLLKDIFVFSVFIAINSIIDQINWQTDKIILGKMVNGTSVAIYAVGANINTMFTNFSTAISNVFAPKINMIVSKNEKNMDEELTSLFIRVGRIQWFLLSLVLTGFIFFGKYFIYRWAGEEYGNAYYVALLLMTPAIVPLSQNIGLEVQRAKYKHQVRTIAYLCMSIVNVGISIWFVSMWGEIGAALGTTISILVVPVFFMNYYYQTRLGINVVAYWRSIIMSSAFYILPVALGVGLMKFYSFKSLLDFGGFVIIYVLVFCVSLYFIGLNENEKNMLKELLNKILNKKVVK